MNPVVSPVTEEKEPGDCTQRTALTSYYVHY